MKHIKLVAACLVFGFVLFIGSYVPHALKGEPMAGRSLDILAYALFLAISLESFQMFDHRAKQHFFNVVRDILAAPLMLTAPIGCYVVFYDGWKVVPLVIGSIAVIEMAVFAVCAIATLVRGVCLKSKENSS
jgi:hypothetical protein